MASVIKQRKLVQEYKLMLSHEEAATLVMILGNIGGSDVTSPRKYASQVYDSLVEYDELDENMCRLFIDSEASKIRFVDNTIGKLK